MILVISYVETSKNFLSTKYKTNKQLQVSISGYFIKHFQ